MIRLIPRKIKLLLNNHIDRRIREYTKYIPQYRPYSRDSDSYIIEKERPDNRNVCQLGLPIPTQNLWLGYGKNAEEYLSNGKKDTNIMLQILRELGYSFEDGGRILDFGCGGGRMLRWLKMLTPKLEVWGCDIDSESITWCRRYLSPPFKFFTITTLSHLPLDDGYFSFIYAGSVFTHIDDLADSWFLELRRTLGAKGKLFITIHDEHTIELLRTPDRENRVAFAKMLFNNQDFLKYKDSNWGMFTIGRSVSSQVFYNLEYLCRILQPFYKILSITKEAYGYQTGLLLEKL
jgi:SAM-dependent methyltransferase